MPHSPGGVGRIESYACQRQRIEQGGGWPNGQLDFLGCSKGHRFFTMAPGCSACRMNTGRVAVHPNESWRFHNGGRCVRKKIHSRVWRSLARSPLRDHPSGKTGCWRLAAIVIGLELLTWPFNYILHPQRCNGERMAGGFWNVSGMDYAAVEYYARRVHGRIWAFPKPPAIRFQTVKCPGKYN